MKRIVLSLLIAGISLVMGIITGCTDSDSSEEPCNANDKTANAVKLNKPRAQTSSSPTSASEELTDDILEKLPERPKPSPSGQNDTPKNDRKYAREIEAFYEAIIKGGEEEDENEEGEEQTEE